MSNFHNAIIFYNEKSGQSDAVFHNSAIKSHFQKSGIDFEIVNVPLPPAEIRNIIKQGQQHGLDLVVAAGGDGTVSMVGSSLINSTLLMGILPIGTGNLLAKELKIPMRFEKALETITSDKSELFTIDTFGLSDQFFLMNLSVGLSSTIMDETASDEKQRLGFFAYFMHFIKLLFRIKMDRFTIEYDGHLITKSASEVIIANSRLLAAELFEWPDYVTLNDGKLDLFIIRAANLRDVIHFVASVFTKYRIKYPIVDYYPFEDYCQIETKEPKKAQADGDTIGETPIRVKVMPQSLKIIVPSVKNIRSSNTGNL
jgi:YegS/Rv2252/BmrU family lipid kinase